ncbi:MAG: nucleotidyltransferase domain-containing protein [Bacteroidetes bacterium]|mgnify:CR=1 FL=1|jgi:hypothetical protein|nr:nucleotidyltransferase [Saprospirales bacterium]RMD97251.1 MAG: nucleotidyltransferase domain-containing protein [Bacteroidota bacterium]
MNFLQKYRQSIAEACARHNVEALYAFGSVLTDKFNEKSDVDFIVAIADEDPLKYAENYFSLKFELEKILKRKVDLLEQKSISNKVFEELINRNKTVIYARRDKRVA